MNIFVGIEGFTLPSRFVIKELCIQYANEEFSHFLFKQPKDLKLSEIDERTIRFTTNKVNQLNFHDGDIPYEIIGEVLSRYREYTVYTYGDEAVHSLQKYLPTTVVLNVQGQGFKLPLELPNSFCGRTHRARYCAKAKSVAIKNFCES